MFKKLAIVLFICTSVLALSSCVDESQKDNDAKYQAKIRNGAVSTETFHFADMGFPKNTRVDSQRSIIHNREDSDYWTGNIYAATPYEPRGVFDFYSRAMPKLGWTLITYSREKEGSMVFERNNRFCQIIMADDGGNGTYLTIIVSELNV